MGVGAPDRSRSGDMTSGTIRTIQLLLAGVILFGAAVVTLTETVADPALLALRTGATLLATATRRAGARHRAGRAMRSGPVAVSTSS